MIATVQIERFSLTSSLPFDEILAAIKAALGHPDMVEFAKRTAAAPSFPEFESIVREGLGTNSTTAPSSGKRRGVISPEWRA